ncbi:MAG TPA: octanoyltransferase [Gammaproteobacteria bacterium]|nr:octanoyltransferase [Gammaproteobacteria bacterium]
MRDFTDSRDANTRDQIWLVEHPAIFTLGQNADPRHLLNAGDIPVLNVDRGGQVTYHGPGQIMMYTLIDLKRTGLGVRRLVTLLEESVIALLAELRIEASARSDAPGVYIGDAKVAALGLRIRRGCSYHGVALNVDLDLDPFQKINPCGFQNLVITRLQDHGITLPRQQLAARLCALFTEKLQHFK